MDIFHTPYYAAGYMFAQAQPRMAAICHFEWSDDQLMAESVAEIRSHWDGLFMFGLDLNVINITNDAIWSRPAVVSGGAAPASMDPRWFVKSGDVLPESITFPTPRIPREDQQEQSVRDLEIDPEKYYPRDVLRQPTQTWPGVTINPRDMLAQRGIELDPNWRKP